MDKDQFAAVQTNIEQATRLLRQLADERSIDKAVNEITGAWDIVAIYGERHGYDYICTLQMGTTPGTTVTGRGSGIAQAIRAATAQADNMTPETARTHEPTDC